MKKIYTSLALIMTCHCMLAQVSFTTLPQNKQLYPRNLSTNQGTILIAGTVTFAGTPFEEMKIKLYRENILQTTYSQTLSYTAGIASFSFSIPITAELANYKTKIYGVHSGSLKLQTTVDSLVSGDGFIIQGQSNAASGLVFGSSNAENQNSYIRVYGSGSPGGYIPAWNKANGDIWDGGGEGNSGQWGLRLAKDILDDHDIPVAIFNGANSEQPINWFARNDLNKYDQATNYGRLLERVTETGFNNNIRSIFWYQGESNSFGGNTTTTYKNSFNDLNNDWNEDFAGFEHLYIIQIKQGCGAPKAGVNKIQEAHRELAAEIGNASIYASNGTTQAADICHYNYENGYKLTGDHLFNLVNRDLYGAPAVSDIESPYVLSASQTALNQITLYFKMQLTPMYGRPGQKKIS